MKLARKPKVIAALLIGGTVLLLGGAAIAASLPSPGHMAQMMGMAASHDAAPSPKTGPPTQASSPPGSVAPSPALTETPGPAPRATSSAPTRRPAPVAGVPRGPITYVVHSGDTLSGIAAWFKLHGYGDLYAANVRVIGANPNLIRPGERITISGGVLTMAPPA